MMKSCIDSLGWTTIKLATMKANTYIGLYMGPWKNERIPRSIVSRNLKVQGHFLMDWENIVSLFKC